MKDLGVTSMAYEMKQLLKGSKQTKKRKKVTKDTDEYTPDEEGELNHSSEEDENEVVALRGKITTNIKDTTDVSSVPMANLTKDTACVSSVPTQRKIQLGKSTAQKKSAVHNQQEKEVEIGNGVQTKTSQSKTVVAPGSLSAYRQMQTQLLEKERRAKQRSSQAQSFSQPQRFRHDLQEDYENHMGANERNLEQYVDEDDEFSDDLSTLTPEELGMQDEPLMNQEHETLPKRKRTRGPTMCKDVHEWTLEERKPIVLNEMGKPIGPDDKTVNTFTRFLGTLARNFSLAPLNKINWHYVPHKEQFGVT
uniref:Uncharacterized protein n=1 Tax=Chenopodium quinoa TaxID=63459 RepID=A0A803N4N9_CHEQI